ncbi:MAG TPA: hypothetical protein VMF32_17085 [Xanthobacteraceae bacterium]|nr:hypothetical protein [Xanthobacteraceae bacterium]
MKNFDRIIPAAVVAAAALALLMRAMPASAAETYGMRQYVDARYHFSFWYPRALQIAATTGRDRRSFPGGINVKTLQVGEPGAISVSVVVSPGQTITDEPNGHAAPMAQTKYFYDPAAGRWMVAFPEGDGPLGGGPPKPADVSTKTIGGLPMLPSSARFDATIIPLSTTLFLVIKDGGGSGYTAQLAKTVAPTGARIDPAALSAALKAEADAYGRQ